MSTSILTINPGTKHWGVSVFHGEEIVTCMIKNLSARDSSRNRLREVQKLLESLFRDFAPDLLILRKPCEHWNEQSSHLEAMVGGIKECAAKENISVLEYSQKDIRKAFSRDGHATKEDVINVISVLYPELKPCLGAEQLHRNVYWGRIISSLALGICHLGNKRKHMRDRISALNR